MSGFFNGKFIAKFVATLAGLGVVAGLAAFVAIYFGLIPLAADKKDPRLFYHVVHSTFKRWVAANAGGITPPDDLDDEGRIALGAQHFAQNCVRCHGAPDIGQNPMVLAMKPTPQHLPSVINQFTDSELFWILQNGVMMSAMPAWPAVDRPDEIWTMVSFIRRFDEMDGATYLSLVTPDTEEAPGIEFGPLVDAREMDYHTRRYPMDEHLYSAPTGGFADYALAGIPVAQCSTCHGADGSGAATGGEAANLTIQSADYIEAALHSYASADRHSAYMQVVASQLSEEQISGLAQYYTETLPEVATVMDEAPDPELVAHGEILATEGRPVDAISACYDCHAAAGETDEHGIVIPELAAQNETFLTRQLQLFRSGGRGQTSEWSPMVGVARNMTDEDIAGAAAYFASRGIEEDVPMQDVSVPPTPEQIALASGAVERVCKECHEADLAGAPSGETPNLTLQGPDYVERQLYEFRSKRRDNSRMHQAALRLEEPEINALSAFIGSLDPLVRDAPEPVSDDVNLGAQLARRGLEEADIPACLTCHGEDTTSALSQIPRLHGQNANYLVERLAYFKNAHAGDVTPYSPMPMIASRMTDDQLRAAAAWFADQQPLEKD
ncbi:c-type cytochrome [Palleronia sp. LCG004]|uniref:c-type cytochrome n=1 Tax=Palleronia sp. LCG004 TaxID=3079304 RepID=UPI00294333D3|nr:c-type cytochrome [Palleronia sp. LCG004]WOI56542.1 c-type cytochrome [Palleronia sp. LCG004]